MRRVIAPKCRPDLQIQTLAFYPRWRGLTSIVMALHEHHTRPNQVLPSVVRFRAGKSLAAQTSGQFRPRRRGMGRATWFRTSRILLSLLDFQTRQKLILQLSLSTSERTIFYMTAETLTTAFVCGKNISQHGNIYMCHFSGCESTGLISPHLPPREGVSHHGGKYKS